MFIQILNFHPLNAYDYQKLYDANELECEEKRLMKFIMRHWSHTMFIITLCYEAQLVIVCLHGRLQGPHFQVSNLKLDKRTLIFTS